VILPVDAFVRLPGGKLGSSLEARFYLLEVSEVTCALERHNFALKVVPMSLTFINCQDQDGGI
jgi:hypothetical protein